MTYRDGSALGVRVAAPAAAGTADLSQFGFDLTHGTFGDGWDEGVEDLQHPRALLLAELARSRGVFADRLAHDPALRFVQAGGGATERRDGRLVQRERNPYHTMQYCTILAHSPRPVRALV